MLGRVCGSRSRHLQPVPALCRRCRAASPRDPGSTQATSHTSQETTTAPSPGLRGSEGPHPDKHLMLCPGWARHRGLVTPQPGPHALPSVLATWGVSTARYGHVQRWVCPRAHITPGQERKLRLDHRGQFPQIGSMCPRLGQGPRA